MDGGRCDCLHRLNPSYRLRPGSDGSGSDAAGEVYPLDDGVTNYSMIRSFFS